MQNNQFSFLKKFSIFLAVAFLFFSTTSIISYAKSTEDKKDDECKPNLVGFDVCKKARELSDELSQQLPMRISKELLVEKVFADKGLVSLTAVLGYNESYLKSSAKNGGITMNELLNNLKQATINMVCQPKSATEAFVNLGGKIQYQYYFIDRKPYAIINIDQTSCQIKKQ